MSGICGVVRLDGSAAEPEELAPLMSLLERRGPDGSKVWCDGPAALGQTSLATTPEATLESLPLTDQPTGCTITADARIDNREDLFAELGITADAGARMGDGELILRGYLAWGEDCPKHLLGDFAFAIWDPRQQSLFAARDHTGMRQLIYTHQPGRFLVFATEARAVVAHSAVDQRINDTRIADFLAGLDTDFTTTFFEEVLRLPPAHCLVCRRGGIELRRYWQLEAQPELKLGSDGEYEAAFLAVFTEAVRCRLRTNGPVGAMLSGGLDSSSIALVASRLLSQASREPLHTLSAVGPDPASCPETRNIRQLQAMPGIVSHEINYADLGDDLSALRQLAAQMDDPFAGCLAMIRGVYLIGSRVPRLKVVLDGKSADSIFFGGDPVALLLEQRSFGAALSEARAQRRYQAPHPPGTPAILFDALRQLPSWNRIKRVWRPLKRKLRRPTIDHGVVAPDLAARVGLNARVAMRDAHSERTAPRLADQRVLLNRRPHFVSGTESYDGVAAALAIEPRDPFRDRRLIELCLSLPWQQLERHGWPKLMLRRIMAGQLPDDVVWKKGKHHLGVPFASAVSSSLFATPQWIAKARTMLAGYVRKDVLDALDALPNNHDTLVKRLDLLYLTDWINHLQSIDAATDTESKG